MGDVAEEPNTAAVGLEYPNQAPEVVALAQKLLGEAGGHMGVTGQEEGATEQVEGQQGEDHPTLAGIKR